MKLQPLVGRSGPDVSVKQSGSRVRRDRLEGVEAYTVQGALLRVRWFVNWIVHRELCEVGYGLEKEAFRKRRFLVSLTPIRPYRS
jgi:hypothetical protein